MEYILRAVRNPTKVIASSDKFPSSIHKALKMAHASWSKSKLLPAAAAAAALVLCMPSVLGVEQTLPLFSSDSQAKAATALTPLAATEGEHFFMGMSGGTARSSLTPFPGNRNATSSPGSKNAENLSSIGTSRFGKAEAPCSAGFPCSKQPGTASSRARASSISTLEENGTALFPLPEDSAVPPSSYGHDQAKDTFKTSSDSTFQLLTAEALKAFCEQSEASETSTVEAETLSITCTSEDCNSSAEEHTEAKTAKMEEVCHLRSPEAAVGSDTSVAEAIRRHAKVQMEQVFSAAVKGKTVVAIGIPSSLPSIAELASQVVVVEMDRAACDNFLTSKSGICSLRRQVQLVCMKSNDMTPDKRAEVTFETAEKLIKRHFNEIPPDMVYVSSDFPVAAAVKLFEEVDQSTTLIIHHRLSYLALKALAPHYRQDLLVYPNAMDEDLTSSVSFVLLRRSYAPRPTADAWRKYLTPDWRLSASDDPLRWLKNSNRVVLELIKATGITEAERNLKLYARTLRQFWVLASDQERASLLHAIDTIATALQTPNPSTGVEGLYRVAFERVVDYVMRASPLKFYLIHLESKIKEVEASSQPFLQALFGDVVVALRRIDSTDTQRRALRQLLRDVNAAVSQDSAQLPRLLHTIRMAIETFNDVRDSRSILKGTQQSCSLPSSKWQA